ncbi:ATP-dependent DNA helicase II subunit 2 [Striga asiatica]|uniref:ATP-dependent DNA helicase II subunit 2 n=1 Tax=Striga asiatica TaxID=4170 RepID=A0A5A7PZL8_STRAF|nr:ATP-dependent DNA helicase II subunit 2 [Striga asiatica]
MIQGFPEFGIRSDPESGSEDYSSSPIILIAQQGNKSPISGQHHMEELLCYDPKKLCNIETCPPLLQLLFVSVSQNYSIGAVSDNHTSSFSKRLSGHSDCGIDPLTFPHRPLTASYEPIGETLLA